MQSYANTGTNASAGPSSNSGGGAGVTAAGYSLGGAAGSGPAGLNGGRFGRLGKDDVELGRYRDKYDESLNPFEAFKGRVSLSTTTGVKEDVCEPDLCLFVCCHPAVHRKRNERSLP